jgi:hypothetical protein
MIEPSSILYFSDVLIGSFSLYTGSIISFAADSSTITIDEVCTLDLLFTGDMELLVNGLILSLAFEILERVPTKEPFGDAR